MTSTLSTRDLEGKVAMVIGGSRNQGSACAELFAARGATTVVSYSQGEHAAARTLTALDRHGVTAEAIRSDATRSADVNALFAGVVGRHGRLDIVVHTVGAAVGRSLADTTDADFDLLIDRNTRSAFHTLRAAARHLADHGHYVALTSALAADVPEGLGLYSAAKAAVERLVLAGAHELAARDITVNAVAPGLVTDSFCPGVDPATLVPGHRRGRLGQPEYTARVVMWLTSSAADWVSGQVIRVDGGLN
ncbi:SDR family oxidoreductase [Nocardia sp. NPDC051463]|uniref:SDR family oxidoreductase n=1 Tax=Nocardia sp. NPDC051463 TaxID=3154845 RepID=UPI0034134E4D